MNYPQAMWIGEIIVITGTMRFVVSRLRIIYFECKHVCNHKRHIYSSIPTPSYVPTDGKTQIATEFHQIERYSRLCPVLKFLLGSCICPKCICRTLWKRRSVCTVCATDHANSVLRSQFNFRVKYANRAQYNPLDSPNDWFRVVIDSCRRRYRVVIEAKLRPGPGCSWTPLSPPNT